MRDLPIGIFDSGIGGLNILGECLKIMPNEDYVYLADRANMPYGEKSAEEIYRSAVICAESLFSYGCKAIAIGCNTATAIAADGIRALYPTRIVVGLEPAVMPCLRELGRNERAAALVTRATLCSPRFKKLIAQADGRILPVAAANLAELLEDAENNAYEVRAAVKSFLAPLGRIDAVVLGCSHYSLASEAIREAAGDVKIYDGAAGEAERLRYLLALARLLSSKNERGTVRFISTQKAARR